MAFNLEAIRRRMEELQNGKKNSNVKMWKPRPGKYTVRFVPWPDAKDDQPFHERLFYYIGDNFSCLTPKQFGKKDPIDELIHKLFSTKDQDDRTLAKKLMPVMRSYAAVVVRGEEESGVMVWAFGKGVYTRLLGFFMEEDTMNYLDPVDGIDAIVEITQKPGKKYPDTSIDLKRRSSPLSEDAAQAKKWLDAIPNINDMYTQKETSEIEAALNDWLSGGGPEKTLADAKTEGLSRGPKVDTVAQLANEVKGLSTTADKKAAPAPKKAASAPKAAAPKIEEKSDDDVELPPVKAKTSLDDAFDELMEDE